MIIIGLSSILIICTVFFMSHKMINKSKEKIENSDGVSKSGFLTMSATLIIWFLLTMVIAMNVMLHNSTGGFLGGAYFAGVLGISGIVACLIAWITWFSAIKKSDKSAEEKHLIYVENNFLYGMGGAFLVAGIIGMIFFFIGIFDSPGVVSWIVLATGLFLIFKIPRWVKKYVERRM